MLYILIFLHQTATSCLIGNGTNGCISLYSYIKPQRAQDSAFASPAVYPYIPTSNRNLRDEGLLAVQAVYPYIPTSNRNVLITYTSQLNAVYPYIPTSNRNLTTLRPSFTSLYILIFLHQTAT